MTKRQHHICEIVAGILAAMLILYCCVGCKQFLVDFAHEVPVACGAGLKDPTLEGKDKYLAAMQSAGRKVADKAGMPSVVITEENVLERLEQTGVDADNYVPWYQQIPSTGIPWLDAIVGLVVAGAGAYLTRKPLRRGLHLLTHNVKEKVDENAVS
jgi:hypothetical protein